MSAVSSNRIRSVVALQWTPIADQRLARMRHDGASMRAIARAFGLSRSSITDRARRLGLEIPSKPQPIPRPSAVENDLTREALPAGHPISWGLLTQGTCLEGSAYSPPLSFRERARATEEVL